MIFNSTKFGFDISTWQDDPNITGSVNFDRMRDTGASFVILRASVGDQFDADFQTYKVNSRGKLPRGVYHYYWNNIDPKIQAQKCLAAIGSEQLEGRVWLDLETTSAGAFVGPVHWKTFIETIRAAGLRVGIYTGYYWWRTNAATADMTYFSQFPLWEAWYTSDPSIVLVARGWDKLTIWQDTSSYPGAGAGVESVTIDHNQWNDAVDFAAEWNVTPPNGGTMLYGKVNTAVLNIRNTGAATGADIGDLIKDDYIIAFRSVNGWWEIDQAFRGGWNGAPVVLANGTTVNDYQGAMWCKDSYIVAVPAPPPPARVVTDINIALAAGSVVTRVYSDGSTESETA